MALPASGALAQGGVQIQVLGQGVQATAGGGNLVNPVTSVSTTVTLAANEWTGGYYQGNGVWYGRPWTALYGSQTQYSTASITVQLGSTPTAPVTLTLVGLNDESGNKNPIQITVNGTTIFNGNELVRQLGRPGPGPERSLDLGRHHDPDVLLHGRRQQRGRLESDATAAISACRPTSCWALPSSIFPAPRPR